MTSWLSRSEGLNSPSLSAKERGPGGEFRELANRKAREERYVLFLFTLHSLRPWRFQRKNVKMNVDDPVEPPPYLFRFMYLHCFDAPSGLDMVPDTPLPGAAPQAIFVQALRAHYFVLSFHNFSQQARPRRGQTSVAQGAALGKKQSKN